ncbi:TetR/AcrR family transcriptional regulator [Amycolatopsis sp. NPDC021455]|uniref:TetR/AcrR family transcriptional regulator n=1 Tax=Amycolatopsis sp. NPDC021455 TaxID=3154901 RepID=UPI0033EDCF43
MRDAVIAATVAELEESGYDKLGIAAVAARAGVHETSIYRRWKTRDGLVAEASFALFERNIPVADRGTLVEDLTATMSAAGRYLDSPLARAAFQFALGLPGDADTTRELREHWATRFHAFEKIFERAAERGEWPATADSRPLLQALIGAVYLRVHVLREPVTPKHLRPLVEAVLAGRPL